MNKCHENNHAIIEHDETYNVLILTWKKFVRDEDFRSIMILFYELTKEKGVTNWCFDSRKQGMVAREDQQWTIEELVRRNYHGGNIKTAIVMPESLFMEVTVDKISKGLEQKTNEVTPGQGDGYQQFQEREQALKWLRTPATV